MGFMMIVGSWIRLLIKVGVTGWNVKAVYLVICFIIYIYAFQVDSIKQFSLVGAYSIVFKSPPYTVLSPILCPILTCITVKSGPQVRISSFEVGNHGQVP